ncbi:MAG: ribosome maturation factor RimM [Maritimibacter harenae]|uniref:Ribosome maturation factor RimM n=1 Tax=Maritimibacter harenae TaxID=2606218 RepID=A0A845M6K9_9RHOB|nr:ribosome maturation factor RimM [Maritimibacter harenae]MZR14689.1 16S rRNA processing protein RimM [Maritimibacter harenae]
MSEDRICVGAFAGSFGVHGEVRLKSFCAEPEDIGTYGPLWTEDGTRSFTVAVTRAIKNGFAADVEEVATKEEADALKGVRLYADRDALPSLPDDEFYHADLIGLKVMDTGGVERGRVSAVHNHGAGDLIEVTGPGFKTPALIPFTLVNVPTVDLGAGLVVIDPPEGALPE